VRITGIHEYDGGRRILFEVENEDGDEDNLNGGELYS
jgi:hypothetical protein